MADEALDFDGLAEAWIANDLQDKGRDRPHWWAWEAAHSLARDNPAQALAFIKAVLARPTTDKVRFSLAAGPLEDLLVRHGPAIIVEVERLARQDALFRDTLRGVWRNAMTEEVWARVQAAHGRRPSP